LVTLARRPVRQPSPPRSGPGDLPDPDAGASTGPAVSQPVVVESGGSSPSSPRQGAPLETEVTMDELLNLCDELAASPSQGAGASADRAVPARRPVRFTLIESSSSEATPAASPEAPTEAQDVPVPMVETEAPPEAQDAPVPTVEMGEADDAPAERRAGEGAFPGSDGTRPSGAEVVIVDDAVPGGEVVPTAPGGVVVATEAVVSDVPVGDREPVPISPVGTSPGLEIVPFPGTGPAGRLLPILPGQAPESFDGSGWGALAPGEPACSRGARSPASFGRVEADAELACSQMAAASRLMREAITLVGQGVLPSTRVSS